MVRPPRVEFAGAIYHVLTRGDGRQRLFHDEGHYRRFTRGLAEEVLRCGWQVFAYCWMPNHVHLLLKTPQANLASGMQHWLSGYANWYAKRNQRSGHLFQGRYKSYLVEDESYYWTLSRYIHLNPCRGNRPLCARPGHWRHSSYQGYESRSRRVEFVQYDELLSYWDGQLGGKDPVKAYRKFVLSGLTEPVENPLEGALSQWVIGSQAFLHRMLNLAESRQSRPEPPGRRWLKRLGQVPVDEIIEAVAAEHQVAPEEYVGFRSQAAGREMAALLCRRYTRVPLAQLSQRFGLQHPDSSANLVRRAKKREAESVEYRRRLMTIENLLGLKTENQV